MQRTLLTRTALAGCAAATFALSACTSGPGASNSHQPATGAGIASFNFAIGAAPSTLSGWSTYIADDEISSLVTQTLQIAHPDGSLTPTLTSSVAHPDPKTLVYTVRPGIKFSDGTALTAQDVAWSITRAATPGTPYAANLSSFASATADGDTVRVALKYDDPTANIWISGVEIMQEKFGAAHLKEIGTPTALPIGTGPYMYAGQSSQAVKLVPNPYYTGTRPKVQNLTFTIIGQSTSAQLAMRSGAIQGIQEPDVRTLPEWEQIGGASVFSAPNLDSNLLSMDTAVAPFNDVHVRQAVAYSLDLPAVLKAEFGQYATPLKAAIPVGGVIAVASESQAQAFYATLPQYDFDPAKAKTELAQSSYPNGFSVTVPYISTDPWMEVLLLNLQQNMAPLGVKINLKPEAAGQWSQTIFSHQSTGLQVLTGFATTSADPSAGPLWGMVGKAHEVPGLINIANFSTPAVEAALVKIAPQTAASYTNAERWDATKTILTQIAQQAAYIPLFSSDNVYILARGATFTQTPTLFDQIDGQWIDYIRASG